MEMALRYNDGKPQWSLVHYKSLEPMIKVLEYGAHKYSIFRDTKGDQYKGTEVSEERVDQLDLKLISTGANNWKKDMDLKKILESIQRHLAALMDGEDMDSESKLSHMGHIQANALFFNYHTERERKLKENNE